MNISAIITYYNEEKKILNTLEFIKRQSEILTEVIFINSSSSDNTRNIIDRFIVENELQKKFKNISFDTKFPSDSSNLGIELSNGDYIFFLDCGLEFDKNFLNKQINHIKKNIDAVFATTVMTGYSPLDVANISQSYGFGKENVILPGSLIKKDVFSKIGKFYKSRSFYDVLWKKKVFSEIKYSINREDKLIYKKPVYGLNPFDVFYKNYKYSEGPINILKNKTSLIYISLFILFLFTMTLSVKLSYFYLISYFATRQIIPFFKSGKNYSYLKKTNIFYIFLSGLMIDVGKLVGFFKSLISLANYKNILFTFLVLVFLSFFSPIYSLLGSKLVIIDEKIKSETAIVMSGMGEATYFNPDFQQRSIIAKDLYNEKLIKNLIIVSGKTQTVHEAKLIEVILTGYGIPKNSLKIMNEYPNSTYDAIIKIKNILKDNDNNEVLFITSPYHSLRTKLIWNKNISDKKIIFPETTESLDKKKIRFFSKFEDIYVIFYEYLSIVYNFILGRL